MTKAYLFFGFNYTFDLSKIDLLHSYNQSIQKRYADCILIGINNITYLCIKHSIKIASLLENKEFSSLPNTEQWQQKLDEFSNLIKIEKQKANWILTIG